VSAGVLHQTRETFLPYALPFIGEEEIAEVVDSLRSGWITTGPKVKRFEQDFASYVGADNAIAVNSCTAALHLSLAALGIGPGDEVIVPTITFCATANVVVHLGARPVLADVDEAMLIDLESAKRAITSRTKAIIPVHYAGQSCDLDQIETFAREHGLSVVEDGAHAAGCEFRGRKIGTGSRATCFSFYATKNMTTGEGGMVTTNDPDLASRIRLLCLHGMSKDAWKRYGESGSWYYEVTAPGYKDNMTDIQASLGIHQLRRLNGFIERRQSIARQYHEGFSDLPELTLPVQLTDRNHVFHIYPIQLALESLSIDRAQFVEQLKAAGIGASVHFIPLHRQPYYVESLQCSPEMFPTAEHIYKRLLSLPLYPRMSDSDVQDVIDTVRTLIHEHREASRKVLK
jgi:dTDP-4-amino-4,6-dideoxygalactose transaminase